MRRILKLAAFCLFPFFAAAQSGYRPGYVVTTKGDTIKGFIDYQSWDNNPSSILFKTTSADRNKQTYSLTNASAFGINGLAAYEKFTVSLSMDMTNTLHLTEGRDTSFKIDTVFLKVLQKGKNLALYSYSDNVKRRFYIGEAPGYQPGELVFRQYQGAGAKAEGGTVTENTYQKQLFSLAIKYNKLDDRLTSLIERSNFEKGDLLAITSQINNISKNELEKQDTQHAKLRPYVSAGVNLMSTTSQAPSGYSISGGGSSSSVLPAFAAGIDLLPDPNGRLGFKFDIGVNPAQFGDAYKLKVSPYEAVKASYSQIGFYFTPQVIYNVYNGNKVKFYLGVGGSLCAFSYSNPIFAQQNGNATGLTGVAYYFNKTGYAALFKAGVKIQNNIEIFVNYYTPIGTTLGGYYFELESQATQIGVSYLFGK